MRLVAEAELSEPEADMINLVVCGGFPPSLDCRCAHKNKEIADAEFAVGNYALFCVKQEAAMNNAEDLTL